MVHPAHHRYIVPFLCFPVLFVICLSGCADSVPAVADAGATVVFSYQNDGSLPDTRLAVFVQPASDAARVSSMDITHIESGLTWHIRQPVFAGSNNVWRIGSAGLMPPYYGTIPQGLYRLTYTDLAERTVSTQFTVQYPVEQPKQTGTQAAAGATGIAEEKIALYTGADGTGALLYYGQAEPEWKNRAGILQKYPNAVSVRICYEYPRKTAVCLMPPENITPADTVQQVSPPVAP